MGGETTADGYISKTGFSSLNIAPQAASAAAAGAESKKAAPDSQIPYEQIDNSRRRSNSKSKPAGTASLFASFAANAPSAAST